jgi:hypothetical protein
MSQHTIDKWNEETKQKQDGKPLPRRVKQAAAALVPPEEVRAAARRGLAARRAAPQSQRGGLTASQASAQGIGSGVVRAQTLASGRGVSPETVKRMHSFFSRHRKNKDTPRGRIAWDLWGGDPGARWAASQVAAMKSSTTTSSAKSHAMKTTKTAASMEQTLQGAISGAIGGALIGSRRSLDDAVVRGMVQGAVTGALAGGAAAQATRDQRAHFGAGVVGGYLGSRGPRGESRPQVHVRMDRHNTGTPESFVTEKHAAASELRRRHHVKLADAMARAVQSGKLRSLANAASSINNKSPHPVLRGGTVLSGLEAMKYYPRGSNAYNGQDVRLMRLALKKSRDAKSAASADRRQYLREALERNLRKKTNTTITHGSVKLAEGNFGHGAELAGLAMLAAPSIQHFRKKPMSDRTSHKINAAGLAVLAAPSLLELAKRHKKTAATKDDGQTQKRLGIGAALAGTGLQIAHNYKHRNNRHMNYLNPVNLAGHVIQAAGWAAYANGKQKSQKKTAAERRTPAEVEARRKARIAQARANTKKRPSSDDDCGDHEYR